MMMMIALSSVVEHAPVDTIAPSQFAVDLYQMQLVLPQE